MPVISTLGAMSARGFGFITGAAGGEKYFVSDTAPPSNAPAGQPTDAKLYNDLLQLSIKNFNNTLTNEIAFARSFTSGDTSAFQPSLTVQRVDTGSTSYQRTSVKDSSGNIWVGYIGTGSPTSIRLVQFDSAGTFIAAYSYSITSSYNLESNTSFQMAITNNDTIYISYVHTRWYYCGGCQTWESYPAIFIRYSNGTTYAARSGLYAPQVFQKSSIWTDGTNVVTAYKNGNFWATIRWASTGTSILSSWASDNAGGNSQFYNASCCDPSGNMYFVFMRSISTYIARINSGATSPSWSFLLNGIPSPYNNPDNGSIDYGIDGFLYVAIPFRNTDDSGSQNTILILKMTTAGAIVWQRTLKISMGGVTGASAGVNEIFINANKKNAFYVTCSMAGNSGNTAGRRLIVCKFPKDGTLTGTYTTTSSGGNGTYVYSNSSFTGYNDGWPYTNYIPTWAQSMTISASTQSTSNPTISTITSPVVRYIP